jgi:cytochrome oxidase Cu insertion factor (SCO1/SenC/PrrC family)
MRTHPSITILALLFAGLALVARAEPKPADEAKTGIAVGQKAPDFTLADQTGQERSLAGLLEAGPVALVFSRSAHW